MQTHGDHISSAEQHPNSSTRENSGPYLNTQRQVSQVIKKAYSLRAKRYSTESGKPLSQYGSALPYTELGTTFLIADRARQPAPAGGHRACGDANRPPSYCVPHVTNNPAMLRETLRFATPRCFPPTSREPASLTVTPARQAYGLALN